jgi:hypothetical protein
VLLLLVDGNYQSGSSVDRSVSHEEKKRAVVASGAEAFGFQF